MSDFLLSVSVLIRKELLMTIKDKRVRIILVMPIIIQTVLFGYVATFDLNSVDYALLDLDRTQASRDLVSCFDGTGLYHRVRQLENSQQIADVLNNKEALMVLTIGSDFERTLNAGGQAKVQVLLDGRNSNVAGVAQGYAETIVQRFSAAWARSRGAAASTLRLESRAWFNPNLETRWGILSSLTAILAVIQVLSIAGQSIAREKEQGTFDQLLVTPLGPAAILLGKAIPPVLVGLIQSSIVLVVALYGFHIPFQGSYLLLYAALIIYNFAVVGIGLCVSACSRTMQQAMLYNFTLLMPMILLSGFATPISSMPELFQWATYCNPVRYGVEFSQRIYLEGANLTEVRDTLWPLLLMALVTLSAAARLFRRVY